MARCCKMLINGSIAGLRYISEGMVFFQSCFYQIHGDFLICFGLSSWRVYIVSCANKHCVVFSFHVFFFVWGKYFSPWKIIQRKVRIQTHWEMGVYMVIVAGFWVTLV